MFELVFDGHVYGNVVWIFVLAAIANLIFLNIGFAIIGFAIAGRAANPDAAQGLGQAVALPMMFRSGTFFPVGSLPKVVQAIMQQLTLTPLLQPMRTVAVDGRSITRPAHNCSLGAWLVTSFLVAGRAPALLGGAVAAASRGADRIGPRSAMQPPRGCGGGRSAG